MSGIATTCPRCCTPLVTARIWQTRTHGAISEMCPRCPGTIVGRFDEHTRRIREATAMLFGAPGFDSTDGVWWEWHRTVHESGDATLRVCLYIPLNEPRHLACTVQAEDIRNATDLDVLFTNKTLDTLEAMYLAALAHAARTTRVKEERNGETRLVSVAEAVSGS